MAQRFDRRYFKSSRAGKGPAERGPRGHRIGRNHDRQRHAGQRSGRAVLNHRRLRASPRGRLLDAYLRAQGTPTEVARINREHVDAFTSDQLSRYKPAAASQRYRDLAQLFKWLTEAGEIRDNPFGRMKPPAVPESPVIADDQLRRLLAACDGPAFDQRRDAALVRLLIDCGVRISELMNLTTTDIDRDAQVVFVVGKGRRPRAVSYGKKTATALDRCCGCAADTTTRRCPPCGSDRKAPSASPGCARCSNVAARWPGSDTCTPTSSATRRRTGG